MASKQILLLLIFSGLPSIFVGCQGLTTHYPKESSASAYEQRTRKHTSPDKQIKKTLPTVEKEAVKQNKDKPDAHVMITGESRETQPVELGIEILPVTFDETTPANSSEVRLAQGTQSDLAEPRPIPLPEAADNTGNHASGGMTLQELESIALANNPAIKELAATTQKAAGYRTQVTQKPNPTVGYSAQQLVDRQTDQHIAFIEQEFVTGGKLQLNQQVLDAAVSAQLRELEAQRMRVTTDIRIRFYQALALQRKLELINEFITVAENGLHLAKLRKEGGEGSQIDVLQASIQLNEVTLVQQQTQAKLSALWREISALAGVPILPASRLEGVLPEETPHHEWEQLADAIVASSPEYAAAQSRILRARANLCRQQKQPVPNVLTQFGAGFDNSTGSGMINLQFGVPLPVHNDNQGNICAAHAELSRAYQESERISSGIKARLAVVSQEYETAVAAVNQYAKFILPSANSSRQLAEQTYQVGETNFLQVLVARKTYFDSNLMYVTAQSELAIAQAKIDGYVLTGALDDIRDESGDDSLRGQTFSQQ